MLKISNEVGFIKMGSEHICANKGTGENSCRATLGEFSVARSKLFIVDDLSSNIS